MLVRMWGNEPSRTADDNGDRTATVGKLGSFLKC